MLLWGISYYYCPALPRLEYGYNTERVDIWYLLPASLLVSPIGLALIGIDWSGWAESPTHRSYACGTGFSIFEMWDRRH